MWQIEMCHRCKPHWGPSGERMQNSHHCPLIWITCWNDNVVDTFSSVQFSHSVMSDSLRPHESQHAKPPCPSQTPGVHPDSRPSSQWCHPAISSSVVPFSSCPQSLPASDSFPMSQLFAWGGQSTLEFQLQHHSLQRNPRADLLQNGLAIRSYLFFLRNVSHVCTWQTKLYKGIVKV